MKAHMIALGAALFIGGCTMASEEDQLENSIRENLSSRGEVKQVELTKSDNDNMTGFAVVRTTAGVEGRMNCTARRTEAAGTNFSWRCVPAIDEAMLTQMEATIRQNLSDQAEVLDVQMTRQDDDRMTGYAQLRDASGNEGRLTCTGARDSTEAGNFDWECVPPAQ